MASATLEILIKAKDEASAALGTVSGAVDRIAGKLRWLGLAGGAALAGTGIAAVKMGMDFEKGMAEVRTLIPDLSEGGFKNLQRDVLDLSKEMGIATSEVVPALYQAVSAGVPPENVIDFMRTAAKASIGGVTDLETAVDGLTTVVNAFGLGAEDAGRVADVMFTAVRLGKTTMEELSGSMAIAAPLAASLGLDISDVAAATATLTKSGAPTAEAMTQIRSALVALQRTTPEMEQALRNLGFESGEAALKSLGFQGTLEALRAQADAMGIPLIKLFGRVEGVQAALGLTGEKAAVARADLEAMKNATGAADQAFATMEQTSKEKLHKALNTIKVTLTELSLQVLPPVAAALSVVIPKLVEWGAALRDVAEEYGAKLVSLLRDEVVPVLRDLADRYGPKLASIWRDDVLAALRDDVLPFLRDEVVPFLRDEVLPELAAWGQAFLDMATDIGEFLMPALDTLRDFVVDTLPDLVQLLLSVLKPVGEFLSDHKEIVIGIALALVILSNSWLTVIAVLAIVLAKWDEISGLFRVTIPEAIDSTINKIQELPIIGEIFTWVMNDVRDLLTVAFDDIKAIVETAINVVRDTIQIVMALIQGDWDEAWAGIKQLVADVWDGIKTLIENQIDVVKDLIRNRLDLIAGIFGDTWEAIKTAATTALDALYAAASAALDGLIALVQAVPGRIAAAIGDLAGLLSQHGNDLLGGLKAGAQAFWDEALGPWLSQLPQRMLAALGDLSRLLYEVGRQVIAGLKQGIEDAVPDVVNAVTGIPGKVLGKIKGGFGIRSPSEEMAEVGEAVMAGLGAGLDAGAPEVLARVETLAMAQLRQWEDAWQDWEEAWTGIKQLVADVWDGIKTLVENQIDIVKDIITNRLQLVARVFGDTWEAMKTAATTALAGLYAAARTALDGLISLIQALRGRITAAIGNLSRLLWQHGNDLLAGLKAGAQAGWDESLGPWLARLPQRILHALGDLSSLLVDAGRQVVAGLQRGIEEAMAQLREWRGAWQGMQEVTQGTLRPLALAAAGAPSGTGAIATAMAPRLVTVNINISALDGESVRRITPTLVAEIRRELARDMF